MKQTLLILCIVIVAPFKIFGQYSIAGDIKGAEGQTVSLKQFRDMQIVEVATTKVEGGKFNFKGNAQYPEFCQLFVGEKGPIQFFVENAGINISIDFENIEQSEVTGSKENDLFVEFVTGLDKFAVQQKQLNDQYVALSSSNVATQEAVMNIRAQSERINSARTEFTMNFVMSNSGKIVSAFVFIAVMQMQGLNISQIEQLVNDFDATTAQSQWVQFLKTHVATNKRIEIGQPFPDISLKSPDDNDVSISDIAGKGKYVLLDFWAAWCGPCRNANPYIVELYKRYKDKGFEIVGISLDHNKDAWLKAIKDDNLIWYHMSDLGYWQSAAAKLYSVSSIPYAILLDKDGIIIAKGLHVGDLAAKLAELFD